MQDYEYKELDKLSNLNRKLKSAESKLPGIEIEMGLDDAREETVLALTELRQNQYRLGCALVNYRKFFKLNQSWMTILDMIASSFGCCSRTLSRLADNCEKEMKLPQMVHDAMLEMAIDPSLKRNSELVQALASAPEPLSKADASASVKAAQNAQLAVKQADKLTPTSPTLEFIDSIVHRIVRLMEGFLRSVPSSNRKDVVRYILEKVVNTLHIDFSELQTYSRPDQVRTPDIGGDN